MDYLLTKKEPIFIIIPVHNRKKTTLACLNRLKEIGVLKKYYVVVIDDGSIDGTAQAIFDLYPDTIVLIGDGSLWWTGAITKGMKYAYEKGAEQFIWLNDDTLPSQDSIDLMVMTCRHNPSTIVSGQCYAEESFKKPTYGGQKKEKLSFKLIKANLEEFIECDCMSGNLVCLPRSVVEKINYPPHNKLPHCMADIFYTLQAKKAGYTLKVLGKATAVSEFNPLEGSWIHNNIALKDLWKNLLTPKSRLYPPAFWNYSMTVYGKLGLLIFARGYFRLVFVTLIKVIKTWSKP